MIKSSSKENIKVFDCTIRDGGLVNNFFFSDEFVKAIYQACVKSGIDYIELGKNNSPKIMSEEEYGPWNFCKEEDLRRIVGDKKENIKIAVMSDIGRVRKEELLPKSESVVDMVRIATYVHQIHEAVELIEEAHKKGYETTVNIMAISKAFDDEIDEVLELVSKSPVDVIYIADSFGSFYPEQIKKLTHKYLEYAVKFNKKVGIHAHNNMQLAFANTITAAKSGASFLDATISGLGRGAGNCPLELLIGYLQSSKYKLEPLLKVIEEYIVPLEKELDWGYSIPYMITGLLNEHPRSAMKARANNDTKYLKFYNSLLDVQQ